MNWVLENLGLIGSLSLEHLRQSLIAVILGFILSIPLGWVAWRYKLVRGPVVSITGLLYTIPSLALLMILPVLTGMSAISEANLILALAIYAIAIMVRSVVDGLNSVDPATRSAATAMGYGSARRFFAVDLPLAGPVVLAGLRVTAVSTISLATVGILVGVTNLGYLFTNGLQRRIIEEVLAGIIAVAAIALLVDLLLLLAGRWLMPWAATSTRQKRTAAQPSTQKVSS
ncbi:ABC transporter permease subunit [Arthrobacter sp. JUb115]|uniref:ABC transporter permease n=1 Tax=Arthrobacter sp. JUb115 TaxID=2485108 RepID=UPI000FBA526A|nr:ABC transporter permease subunit [Arthrobacter sp. JUb115]TDU30120.1 osmoprotectant transport system permease protein [Arthrobacter sp. JUb115]